MTTGKDHLSDHSTVRGDVAIIGMACVFPKAPDLRTYWRNIVAKVDAIGDPPAGRGFEGVYDPDSDANDRISCQRGGYLDELPLFNPADFGIMPVSLDGAEPEQFMGLKVAHDALMDAGFPDMPLNRERTEVILGRGTFVNRGYISMLHHGLMVDQMLRLLKDLHPEVSSGELETLKEKLKANLPPFSAATAPGLAHSVMAGIIANRLDLKGTTLVLDAACASCLIALEIGIRDLLTGKCDVLLTGGVQISTPPLIHMLFTQLDALSRLPHLRPFDKEADGTMLGEGIGMMVVKRLEDAVKDGHRIYAVVKGIGSSSDGREKGLLAPRVEGEELALRRAYGMAGLKPDTVDLIEAHGTALPLGDRTEIRALRNVFGAREGGSPRCALGTVKSMIGHLIPAAGIAGMIKTALAVYHKVLPPTLYCETPDPELELEKTPFYINSESRPWIHGVPGHPRRAGVNAFGFGGVNTHAILEEYPEADGADLQEIYPEWDTELCVIRGRSRDDLIAQCETVLKYLSGRPRTGSLLDMAHTLNGRQKDAPSVLSVVASSLEDLRKKLDHAVLRLKDPDRSRIKDKSGIYFFEKPLFREGKLAFLFPGEGSQYVNMLSDLCLNFPEVRSCFDLLDRAFADRPQNSLPSRFIFPPPGENGDPSEHEIWEMNRAVDAVITADRALLRLFTLLGVRPDAVLGHSSGEIMALEAAGAVELRGEEELIQLIRSGNRMIETLAASDNIPEGVLLAVGGVEPEDVRRVVEESEGFLAVSMDNCPHQTVLCGTGENIQAAAKEFRRLGGICQTLPFQRAYHTPLFEPVLAPMERFFGDIEIVPPGIPIYSCMTGELYPPEPEEIRKLAVQQWARAVRFRETVETMYGDGFRIFLEVGPRGNLTGFVNDILKGKEYIALASNVHHRPGLTQLQHTLGLLAAHSVPLNMDLLFKRRTAAELDLEPGVDGAEIQPEKPRGIRLPLELPVLELKREDAEVFQRQAVQRSYSQPSSSPQPGSACVEGRQPAAAILDRGYSAGRAGDDYGDGRAYSSKGERPQTPSAPRAEVMEEYFRTMERFLEVQQEVMEAYLDAGSPEHERTSRPHVPEGIPAGPPGKTASQVPGEGGERYVPCQEGPPCMGDRVSGEVAPKAGPAAVPDRERMEGLLISCISERTGYPPDMIKPDQNLEADLGIDSIKRVEILGIVLRQTGISQEIETDSLSHLKTVKNIVDFLLPMIAGNDPPGEGDRAGTGESPLMPDDGTASILPLLGDTIKMVPGREILIARKLNMEEDLFLGHHTLGGHVSRDDETLLALPLAPLSMSLEIMAEAASRLFPGKILTGMKRIMAHGWVALEGDEIRLEAEARVIPGSTEARVLLRILDVKPDGEQVRPAVEGVMIFGDSYPEPPPASGWALGQEMAPTETPGSFYPEALFHGPLFQSVRQLKRCERDGAEALLEVPQARGFFRDVADPVFLSDPVILDGAGQVVGLWAQRFLDANFVLFPVSVEEVSFHAPPLSPPSMITCLARIAPEGETHTQSDIRLTGQGGSVLCTLKGLRHQRASIPEILHRFRGSRDVILSSQWEGPVAALGKSEEMVCCRLDSGDLNFSEPEGGMWRTVVAFLVLGREERRTWAGLKGSEKRRTEWLLARIAGKEAVRLLISKQAGPDLWPADIQIRADEKGGPLVTGNWGGKVKRVPSLSLTHSKGIAIALASAMENGSKAGIDLEIMDSAERRPEDLGFRPEELKLIKGNGTLGARELMLRFWCAKEAEAKALGLGLPGGPRDLVVRDADQLSGKVTLEASGGLLRALPSLAGRFLDAYTVREGALVAAVAINNGGDDVAC